MTKKILAIILALLMIVPMLASCGDEEKSDRKDREEREEREDTETTAETDLTDGNVTEESTSAETEDSEPEAVGEIKEIMDYVDSLSLKYDFSGKTFTLLGNESQVPETLEETGDLVNDSLYYRHRDIEEKFGIDLQNVVPEAVDGDVYNGTVRAVLTDVLAGTGAYDAGYGTAPATCQPLFTNGALADVSTLRGIDLSREWWTKSFSDTYSIGGKHYFLNGPITTTYYTDTHAVLFNRELAEDYGISDLYSTVQNGEWTFDKLFTLAANVPTNENGAGVYRYATPNGIAVLYANGYPVTQLDSKGLPYVPASLPKEISDIADKFSAVFADDAQTVHVKNVLNITDPEIFKDKYGYEDTDEMFAEYKILFKFTTTDKVAELRKKDVSFGILPMPKGTSSQDNYVSYADPWLAFNVFVPKTTKDATVTGVILEAMAALGRIYLKNPYYDNLLMSRSTYDYDSLEMLDIIFETKVYDLVGVLEDTSHSDFTRILRASIQESSDDLASRYTMQARIYNRKIQSILKTILD